MKNKVSLIIPCFNADLFLKQTLVSVEEQTYSQIEVILVNDGSTDSTLRIMQSFQKISKYNVIILDVENGGVSSARNKGLMAATGVYIVFLDADDKISATSIENLVEAMELNNADISYGLWTCDEEKMNNEITKSFYLQDSRELMQIYMRKTNNIAFFNCLYRANIIKNNNILFSPDLKYGEDNLFFWMYICYVKRVSFVDAHLYWYNNENLQSAMAKSSWRNVDALNAIEDAANYMRNKEFKYFQEFYNYMPARTMLSVAKGYATHHDAENYIRFLNKYPVRKAMKKLMLKEKITISFSAFVLGISPKLFYILVQLL